MKFLPVASAMLAVAVAGCGTLTGTPETATSLNGFRASHGLSQLNTDGALTALASEHAADMARRHSLDHDGFITHRGQHGRSTKMSPMAARNPPASSSSGSIRPGIARTC